MPPWLTWELALKVGGWAGGIATAAGLLFAIVQTWQAKAHANALSEIHKSLTTRYIGQFPDFCRNIVDVIGRAKSSIVIMCDFPGYAAFSAPSTFLAYRQILERKLHEGVKVSLTCYDSQRRREFFDEGFRGARTWEAWRQENLAHLREYLRHEGREKELETLTQSKLGDLLEEEDRRILTSYLRGAEIREMGAHLPVYCWLVDGMEAIFVFSVRSEQAFEHGFATTDARLITALLDLRNRYHRESDERAAVRAAA